MDQKLQNWGHVRLRPDGTNNGKNAGRYCWKLAGTLCGGIVQGAFATKVANCMGCDFFKVVKSEEGGSFKV